MPKITIHQDSGNNFSPQRRLEIFITNCEIRSLMWAVGEIDLHTAVDWLAARAAAWGIDTDHAQHIMSEIFRNRRAGL